MRAHLGIILTAIALLFVLVALNAASYVEVERAADTESEPNRSTTNAGATGTRAFYELLEASGYKPARWREPFAALNADETAGTRLRPATLVIVGRTRRSIGAGEAADLLQWVAGGGRLVIVDRAPNEALLGNTEARRITATRDARPDSSDAQQSLPERLVAGVQPLTPAQPTLLARQVERVLPSRFAARFEMNLSAPSPSPPPPAPISGQAAANEADNATPQEATNDDAGDATGVIEGTGAGETNGEAEVDGTNEADEVMYSSPAAVVHFADEGGALLVDYAYGQGRIVLLGDPFIVANNGISRADNVVLALNIVGSGGGVVAFDEYHQGLLPPQNEILAYFRSTPALALVLQTCLLAAAWFYSRGRRFARPVPHVEPDRRSKLEFVASLAELYKRTQAYDLAIENLYRRTRRALARIGGTPADAPRAEIAHAVAVRTGAANDMPTTTEIETLMRRCEDVINGTPIAPPRALELARDLRALEHKLNLRHRSAHASQPSHDASRDSRAA